MDESKLFGTLLGIQKISCLRVGFVSFELKIIDLKNTCLSFNSKKLHKKLKMAHIIFVYVILSKYATITNISIIMRTKV